MTESFTLNPADYIKVGDEVHAMWRSTALAGIRGTVLEIGPGEYGYRTFVIQELGTEFGKDPAVGVPESEAIFTVRLGDVMVHVPLPLIHEEAEKKEARRVVNERKRAEKKVPLFADQIAIAEPDADDMVERSFRESCFDLARRHNEAVKCNEVRLQVAALCSPEDFAYLQQRAAIYPEDPLYRTPFWQKMMARIKETGQIERLEIPKMLHERLNLPWLKNDARLTWHTAPGGPQGIRVLFIGGEEVLCRMTGEPMKDFNPKDFPESRNVWLKPEEIDPAKAEVSA